MIEFIVTSDLRCPLSGSEDCILSPESNSIIENVSTQASDRCRFVADLGNLISSSVPKETSLAMRAEIISRYKEKAVSFFSVFGKEDLPAGKTDILKTHEYAMRYRAFDVSDYRCIFLDTVFENEDEIYVDDEQFAWLSRLLGKSHRPAIIFSNNPIDPNGESTDVAAVKNSKALSELFEKSKKVVLVVSAHPDKFNSMLSNGVPYVNIPPTSPNGESSYVFFSVSSVGVEIIGCGSDEPLYIKNEARTITKDNFWTSLKKLFSRYK